MDLWRLPEGKAAQLIDFPHVFSECVSLIEWPEKLGAGLMPEERLEVRLTHAADPLEDDECGRVARLEETSAKARAELDIELKFVDWFSNRGEGYEHNMTALDRRLDGMVRSAREASAEPFSPSVRLAA